MWLARELLYDVWMIKLFQCCNFSDCSAWYTFTVTILKIEVKLIKEADVKIKVCLVRKIILSLLWFGPLPMPASRL